MPLLVAPLIFGVLATPSSGQSLDDARQREQEAAAALAESSAAVQAAGARLAELAAAVPAAEQAASVARGELAGARAKASAARAEADRAERQRAAAQAQVDEASGELERSRDELGQLARRAYQRGRLGDLREVMAAGEPQDALERSQMLQSVFDASTTGLDRLTAARLSLASKTALLEAQERAAAEARERAEAEEAHAARLAAEAEAAAARAAALVAEQQQAVAAAEALREQDQREYEEAQATSRALGERIRAQAAAAAAAASARRGPAPAPPPRSQAFTDDGTMLWPGHGRLTSRFGWRVHPIFGTKRLHAGIDIGGGYGAPVLAADDGVVIQSGSARGYGTLLVIQHDGNLATAYGHMSALLAREGQRVSRGQTVGRIGNEGNSTGPHLHFEVRVNGEPVDPLNYVSPP